MHNNKESQKVHIHSAMVWVSAMINEYNQFSWAFQFIAGAVDIALIFET